MRRRSNTAQSLLRPTPPLKSGDSTLLNAWVHDIKECPNVIFNFSAWPGVAEGDMLSVKANNNADSDAFFFIVPKEDVTVKPLLQISVPQPIADTFKLRNNTDVVVTKVEKDKYCADYVEFTFQDQYLGRSEMWRLGKSLVGRCIYTSEEISFIGSVIAKIQSIYIAGEQVSAAFVTSHTKAIYRSLSARVTIFIQVCRELWEFAGDGERYNEKIVHSFLPTLFEKWRAAGTSHTVTIVLISRVYYDESEIDYAAGPLRRDEWGCGWYKDFYKVITDLEVNHEWESTLFSLKNSFWDFQRDILLTHHYHQAVLESAAGTIDHVRLVGRLSAAHDGPILEALNIALNPTETHYIDRSLTLTGSATILITPGTGYYRVSKQLLRLTTTRMLDQGFGMDLICLTKPPLHQSPIFSFQGAEPGGKEDPLWGGNDDNESAKTTFWWEPFWISVSFWDKQMDLPFRQDRFIARAKMHEIQMLGLLEQDVLASIEVPFLPDPTTILRPISPPSDEQLISKNYADKFDHDIFSPKSRLSKPDNSGTPAFRSATSSKPPPRTPEKRFSHRDSIISPQIPPIEESPRLPVADLPSEKEKVPESASSAAPGTSPSQLSVHSVHSNKSSTSSTKVPSKSSARSILTAKLTPWLFKPFRSDISEPQTSPVAVSASVSSNSSASSSMTVAVASPILSTPRSSVAPMAIKSLAVPATFRQFDDEALGTRTHRSPLSTPPREEGLFAKRKSLVSSALFPSSPSSRPNPLRPNSIVTPSQSALASRWQHIFPRPVYKHDIKWKSIVTPGCLPLTVEYYPFTLDLETHYDVFPYDFVIDPTEMRSFLVKQPQSKGDKDAKRREWALVVMRGMVAVRLAQGFQFVLRQSTADEDDLNMSRRSKSFTGDDMQPRAAGASEVLRDVRSTYDPVFLSMSNEIHRIAYTGEAVQLTRYVRRMSKNNKPYEYQCLMWPKLGVGYTEQTITFSTHGLENYGWNRLDMLAAGYEHQFSESLRYWRTRFVVIPTSDPPPLATGIAPESPKLNDEEIRILGVEKLAEQFTKLRWQSPDDNTSPPPVRFLPTTLSPTEAVVDETLLNQLAHIHAAGPLKKKMKSEREISEMTLSAIAKAMREEDGVPIKYNQWHRNQYPDSFTGFDFVSWLVREFGDVSSRSQGAEWGVKLLEQGLFEHVRGYHGFLDGHYFYRLKGEYAIPSTPRGWFRSRNPVDEPQRSGFYPGNTARTKSNQFRRPKKRLILSQTMVIDIDPHKRSDQAETVILHHDIVHNPATVFHFELQWIGTTARYIEEQLRQWNKTIERYGLKLVETYVTQISDIRERNAFQSCFPLRLAVPPPIVPNLRQRVPEGTQIVHYFEYALLQKFDFIIDVEASDLYPEHVDVVYSYRRSPFKYSQFVHRSGVAFVQVLGGSRGFLFLTNRLIGPGRMGATMKNRGSVPAATATEIRTRMENFFLDKAALNNFYDEILGKLEDHVVEEPPPLSI